MEAREPPKQEFKSSQIESWRSIVAYLKENNSSNHNSEVIYD